MEAWILHIKKDFFDSECVLRGTNDYGAWSSEKQAHREAGKYLLSQVSEERWFQGDFCDDQVLCTAVNDLIQASCIETAIALTNLYSRAVAYHPGRNSSKKVSIRIIRSKFLGSVFD
jgi:hypothetical protein